MPIVAADLIGHNAANKPQDDVATGGGARDVDNRFDLIQLAANDTLEMVSSASGDTTQGVTVFGRDAAGAELSDTQTVNGTSVVAFTGTFERIISVLMDADAVGIVTVRRSSSGPTVYAIPIGERGASALFIKSASAVGAVTRYDKIFWENAHATLTLTAATVELTADPDSRIRIGVALAKNDTVTITNRLTAPAGITFVDDSVTQAVPGNTLEALSDIGVWIEQALLAADPPFNSSFTTELAGTST